jgi:glycosyltransferase involved in cell wall biosynthesis
MRILIATDAWHPQVNGVVRTFETLERELVALGHQVLVLGPDRFPTVPMPSYPEIRLAVASTRRLAALVDGFRPDAIHIPVEGPLGIAMRKLCRRRGWPFSSSYHTRAGLYFEAKFGLPGDWLVALQRRFHEPAAAFLVHTPALGRELAAAGFRNVRVWARGVDLACFRPRPGDPLLDHLPRPIFLYVGRISSEKRIEEFLALDLPGTKLVVGDGPQRAELEAAHPDAVFVGTKTGEELARHYAAADVFVFPSRFETFGLVILEALASGLPVAAYPVHGPKDIIGAAPVGVLDEDLRAAALRALGLSRADCRRFAEGHSWRRSAELFVAYLTPLDARRQLAA